MEDGIHPLHDAPIRIGRRLNRPWFAYAQSDLRFQAVPVRMSGWLALATLLMGPLCITQLPVLRPAIVPLALGFAYVVAFLLLILIVRARGNRYAAPVPVMRDCGVWLWRAAAREAAGTLARPA